MPSTLSLRYWQCSCLLSSTLSCSNKKYPDCHCTSVILPWIKHTLSRRQGNYHCHPRILSTGQLAQPRKGFLHPSPYPLLPRLAQGFHLSAGKAAMSTHKHGPHWLVEAVVRESGYLMVTGGTDCQQNKRKSKINHFFFVLLKINCFG